MNRITAAGRKSARFLRQPSVALALWLFTALFAQVLVALALLATDKDIDGLREGSDVWVTEGGAPTIAVGLLAAALAESLVRTRPYTAVHGFIGMLGVGLIVYIAFAHNDVLRGDGTAEQARGVSGALIAGAAILGAVTTFVSSITQYRAEQQKQRTDEKPARASGKTPTGRTADVS